MGANTGNVTVAISGIPSKPSDVVLSAIFSMNIPNVYHTPEAVINLLLTSTGTRALIKSLKN
jgi:hypothetical protein